ncbi:MAG: Peptidylprolyl isomerase, FKBP-type, partial [uncultured Gemmatimonadetes bacterium]
GGRNDHPLGAEVHGRAGGNGTGGEEWRPGERSLHRHAGGWPQVRQQPRPRHAVPVSPGCRQRDPRVGRGRGRDEGGRAPPADHSARAGLRRSRRGKRDPTQRDAGVRRGAARRQL